MLYSTKWSFLDKIHLVQETWAAISLPCFILSKCSFLDTIHLVQENPCCSRNLGPLSFHHRALFHPSEVSRIRSILSMKPGTIISPPCSNPSKWGFLDTIHLVQENPSCPWNLWLLFHHCALFHPSEASWIRSILSKKPETAISPLCFIPSKWSLLDKIHLVQENPPCPRNLEPLFHHCALFHHGGVSWIRSSLVQETWDCYFTTMF